MKAFPKKYNAQDLRNRSKKYKEINNYRIIDNNIFSPWDIPVSEKLSYQDLFYHYIRDFWNYINNKKNKNNEYQQLFIASSDQIKSICSVYEFFNKRNQRPDQVWIDKFERRIKSTSQKNIKANNKILENYLSSKYKIYIPDSDLYLYVLNKFHSLREKWKLKYEKKIWYRSFNLQTSISAQHITWKEETRPFYVLKYFVWAKCEILPVCLDDIDLCCWDVALLVHPKDKRYSKYIWKNAIIPLCNRQIPIIWDENVNIALNNWIQRVCPCSDQESIGIAEKYWLPTDIYVFNQQWLYTDYIHEPAFIWQERNKYYSNIEWFINDIWNLERKWEKSVITPYLSYINERLIPYKIDQITLDLSEEKQTILNKIFNKDINISFIDTEFWEILKQINSLQNEEKEYEKYNNQEIDEDDTDNFETNISELKQKIIDKIDKYLQDSLVCNSQLQYWRRVPLIKKTNWNISFFDLEKECLEWKEKSMLLCFNFVILSLVRIWIFWNWSKNDKTKLCEYNKFTRILSENEKKIEYFVKHLSEITWDKPEYNRFCQIIQNLTDEQNSSISEFLDLAKESNLLQQDWNRRLLNLSWISNDIIDHDFVQLCIPCYLYDKNININNQIIFREEEKTLIFKKLLIQELLLWKTISNDFKEFAYNNEKEFLWDKQLTKLQKEQSQRNLFQLYWESPVRLNFLIDQTYDQKEIILNNFFLKQIWNATRLCIQKDFLPKNVEEILNNQPEDLEDLDIWFLYNLNNVCDSWKDIETYEQYVKFFTNFKWEIQNSFFSRYLEVQKIKPSKNIQFICCYFFNLLLNILYPLTPEFVDALQYISERKFLLPVNSVQLNKSIDFNLHLIYDTFLRIKNIKIENNIKQHESCNIFIKSNPTICEIFSKYEQIFKNYFHISEISYIRLHEQSPLWYETFSNDTLTIGIQPWDSTNNKEKDSLETLERDIKNLEDKINLLRQRLNLLPEWEERKKAEEEYANTKDEMENLSIKYSILSSK